MPFISITSGLTIKVPTRGTTGWDETMRTDTFNKISSHNHTGSGNGSQLTSSAFAADALDFDVIRGDNDQWLTARNNANSADLNLLKANTSDLLDFGITISDDAFTIGDNADGTKALDFQLSGATASTTTTIAASQSADRTVTLPNATTTLVGTDTTDTLTNKTLTSPVLTTPQINDTSLDHQYIFGVSELAADRTVTLPLLTGNDTFVFADFAQLLKNKTLEDSTCTIVDNADNTKKIAFQASGITTGTTRTITMPDADLTLIGAATTTTFTNKTFDADGTGNSITNIENADIKAAAAIDAAKIHDASVSNTEFGYLNGVTSAIQTQLDAKLPTTITTTGDIIYSSSGSTAARLGIGTAGQVLQVSGGIPAWGTNTASPIATVNKTTTYTATTADDVITVDTSGGAWTLTLYAASGNSGRKLTVVKTENSTNALTIDGNASETIDGNTTIKLSTLNESVQLVCDGSNWHIIEHRAKTEWVDFTMTIGGETTAPTKATTTIVDDAQWRRVGDSMEVQYTYRHTDSSGAAAGSGNYIYNIPTGYTVDESKIADGTTNADFTATVGHGMMLYGSSDLLVGCRYQFGSGVYLVTQDSIGGMAVQSSASRQLAGSSTISFSIRFIVPITDWLA